MNSLVDRTTIWIWRQSLTRAGFQVQTTANVHRRLTPVLVCILKPASTKMVVITLEYWICGQNLCEMDCDNRILYYIFQAGIMLWSTKMVVMT